MENKQYGLLENKQHKGVPYARPSCPSRFILLFVSTNKFFRVLFQMSNVFPDSDDETAEKRPRKTVPPTVSIYDKLLKEDPYGNFSGFLDSGHLPVTRDERMVSQQRNLFAGSPDAGERRTWNQSNCDDYMGKWKTALPCSGVRVDDCCVTNIDAAWRRVPNTIQKNMSDILDVEERILAVAVDPFRTYCVAARTRDQEPKRGPPSLSQLASRQLAKIMWCHHRDTTWDGALVNTEELGLFSFGLGLEIMAISSLGARVLNVGFRLSYPFPWEPTSPAHGYRYFDLTRMQWLPNNTVAVSSNGKYYAEKMGDAVVLFKTESSEEVKRLQRVVFPPYYTPYVDDEGRYFAVRGTNNPIIVDNDGHIGTYLVYRFEDARECRVVIPSSYSDKRFDYVGLQMRDGNLLMFNSEVRSVPSRCHVFIVSLETLFTATGEGETGTYDLIGILSAPHTGGDLGVKWATESVWLSPGRTIVRCSADQFARQMSDSAFVASSMTYSKEDLTRSETRREISGAEKSGNSTTVPCRNGFRNAGVSARYACFASDDKRIDIQRFPVDRHFDEVIQSSLR